MTDYSTARTAMVDCQVRPSDVTKYPIIQALLSVPREEFVPSEKRSIAYVGDHIPLGRNRVLLEARTFAKMLDAVNIQPNEMVLDLGCGLGYSTAVIALMAEAVVAVEEDPDLAREASAVLSAQAADNAIVVEGEIAAGAPKHGPYDVIIVEAAIEDMPQAILAQLKEGGRIVALFQNEANGQCCLGLKTNGQVNWRIEFDATAPVMPGFEKPEIFTFA